MGQWIIVIDCEGNEAFAKDTAAKLLSELRLNRRIVTVYEERPQQRAHAALPAAYSADPTDWSQVPITALGFDTWLRNTLHRSKRFKGHERFIDQNGVWHVTVGSLLKMTPEQILGITGIADAGLDSISAALKARGLCLAGEDDT